MDFLSLVILLAVLAALAGMLVWLFSRVQERHRAHYRAMIAVARARGLTFADDPDPAIRLRLEGTIDGIKVRIRSSISSRGGRSGPSTEVWAACASSLPKGTRIELDPATDRLGTQGEESPAANKYLSDRHCRQAIEPVTKPQWAHPQARGFVDADGIHIQAPCLVDGEEHLSRMISTSLNASRVMADFTSNMT